MTDRSPDEVQPIGGPASSDDDRSATPADDPRRVLEALLGIPFTEGNRIDVLRNGNEIFPAWLEAIRQAKRSIDLLAYLWGKGPITHEVAAALAERARAGVRVRILLDALGAKGIDRSLLADLRRSGAQVAFYRPVPNWRLTVVNARTHRRALICDEEVAFTGGTGVDEAWTGGGRNSGDWRDTGFRVRGPVVDGLRAAFAAAWMQTPHPLIGAHDRFAPQPRAGESAVQVLRPASQPGWNDALVAIIALLHSAQDSVNISTPYARMPYRLLDALTTTAERGVTVRLLIPGPHVDHSFARLQGDHEHEHVLEAGIELWSYQPSMLHAKIITVDGRRAMIGTVNFDARSLVLNEQVALVVDDPGLAGELDDDFEADLRHSKRTTPDQWRRRGRRRRLLESAAHAVGRPVRGMGAVGMTGHKPWLTRRGCFRDSDWPE